MFVYENKNRLLQTLYFGRQVGQPVLLHTQAVEQLCVGLVVLAQALHRKICPGLQLFVFLIYLIFFFFLKKNKQT